MTRRLFGASMAAAAAPSTKLKDIEIFRLPVNHRGGWVLVRVHTDQGVTGIGDASHARDDETITALRGIFAQMRGRGFSDIEYLRSLAGDDTAGVRGRAVAMSAIEQAMWDISGQVYGVPVYALLGGALRTSIRNYANINRCTVDRTPAGFAKWAEHAITHGFDAVKLAPFDGMPQDAAAKEPHTQRGIECARAVRKTIGDRDLLIDAHSHFTAGRGVQLTKDLEPLRLFWLEEVCRGIPELARVHAAAKMQTAGGESIFGTRGFYPYITGKAVDVLMPDIKYGGGLLEIKKIAAMGEAAGLKVSPHGPASPIGNIAGAHVCATLPNFLILEFGYGEVEWRAEVIEPAENVQKGNIVLSDKPGFGVRINDKLIQSRAEKVTL